MSVVDILATGGRDTVERPRRVLGAGGVVLLPTDSGYGLAVSPEHDDAIDRLFVLKQRPRQRNLPVMVDSPVRLSPLGVRIGEGARRLLESDLMPGPLTVVLGFGHEGPCSWLQGRREVAVRIPSDPFMLSLLHAAGPLLVTSANLHGLPTMQTVPEILLQLAREPALAVDGGRREAVPSSLVNCAVEPPVIEREGIVSDSRIREILG
ncbi:MAG: threonylcarbamoyl-AMP synthase [Alphaproteobacteria bacterium]|nr:threonylcarbamoyl-AMP synthase [Alphaproteobacteria bacterium]